MTESVPEGCHNTSSATQELDDLMASLSDFKVSTCVYIHADSLPLHISIHGQIDIFMFSGILCCENVPIVYSIAGLLFRRAVLNYQQIWISVWWGCTVVAIPLVATAMHSFITSIFYIQRTSCIANTQGHECVQANLKAKPN